MIHLVPVRGTVPYRRGLEWQRKLARDAIDGRRSEDVLLLLEHDPVLTLGRGAREEHVVAPAALLERQGVDRFEVERGGDVTYHGPGQLVGYPILDLRRHRRDLHWYLRMLEKALIEALARLDLHAFPVPGFTGVWTGDRGALADVPTGVAAGRLRKIASIGVHVSRWVTWHGFALNLTEEPLRRFGLIVPCGIDGVRMTSLRSEGRVAERPAVERAVGEGIAAAFETPVRFETPVEAGDRLRFGEAGASPSARADAATGARPDAAPPAADEPAGMARGSR